MKKNWKKISWKIVEKKNKNFFESSLLKLNSNKAKILLKWKCVLTFDETIKMIADWYQNYYYKKNKKDQLTFKQIRMYENILKRD
jgi:hypothetical protein